MKETAKKLLDLPMKSGELDNLLTVQDANGANLTLEQAMILKQIQAAAKGNTEAAVFVQQVIGEELDESDDTYIQDAASDGDTYKMLCAMRDKLAVLADKTTSPREFTSLTRQLTEITDRIEQMKKNKQNKEGENPLNVILFSRAEKQAKRAARA